MNEIQLIKRFEGCKLTAYKCPAGIWTIGYGNTYYSNGSKVQEGDTITQEQAENLLSIILTPYQNAVKELTKNTLNDNQNASVISFAYNVGIANLKSSTLLKLILKNPNDLNIKTEFMKWNKAAGKTLVGLTNRRMTEYQNYIGNLI